MSTALSEAAVSRSIRRRHERSCGRKMLYPNREYAHAVVLWVRYQFRAEVQEYFCSNCGAWHTGHTEPLPRKRGRA